MEIISKVSLGSKMDQIYIPKNRVGFGIGNYVLIKSLDREIEKTPLKKIYFYGIKNIESIKLEIINEVFRIIDKSVENYENIIITGSFLEEGFHFNDIDIIVLTENTINFKIIGEEVKKNTGINGHILVLSSNDMVRGLETDPLYQMMLSRCVIQKRFIYKTKHTLNYHLLDLHLFKSKTLLDNFEVLNGREKYNLVRNLVTIYLYLGKNKVSVVLVDKEIKNIFGVNVQEIKDNILDEKDFIKKYKLIYNKSFNMILRGIENGSK